MVPYSRRLRSLPGQTESQARFNQSPVLPFPPSRPLFRFCIGFLWPLHTTYVVIKGIDTLVVLCSVLYCTVLVRLVLGSSFHPSSLLLLLLRLLPSLD